MATLVVNPTLDTYTQESDATNEHGTLESLQVNTSAGARRLSLLIFDVSSIAGATVNSATLSLYNVFTSGSNRDFPVHAILVANANWEEDATWNFADGAADRWAGDASSDGGTDAGCSVSGTDYDGTAIGTVHYAASSAQDTENTASLTAAAVQDWVDGNNYGLVVLGSDAATRDFRSKEYGTAANHPKLTIDYTAAGGTTYNQSVAGGVTPTSTLLNQAQKVLTGSVTPTATLLKQVQKVLAGNVTLGSTLIKEVQKVLAGTVTPTGALLNQTEKILSGVITPSGALANQVQKVLSGAITPLGQLLKETQKVLTGNLTPGGILTSTKTALISLVGSLTPSGVLTKETQKALSGVVTPVGSILKQVGKILSGTLTPVGVLVASLVSTNLESSFKGMFRGMFRRMK